MGLERTALHAQLGQVMDKIHNNQNTQLLLLKSQEPKHQGSGSQAGPVHPRPPKGWADHLSHAYPHPTFEPACPASGEGAREPLLLFTLSCRSRSPRKVV